jgi:ribosomal protein S18 acetylase RimI-like enzyme
VPPASGGEPEGAAPCELLDWDSQHFGFRVASVLGKSLSPERANEIDEWCADQEVRCLYLLADADDGATAEIAADHGYLEADVRVTMTRPMKGVEDLSVGGPETLEIREATEDELGPLLDLAGRSHLTTRFYADPGFPRERSDALYRAWLERGFRHPDRGLLVAMVDGEPAGYEVYRRLVVDGEGHGELAAVDERFRRLGIARALHVTMFKRLADSGAVFHRGVLSGRNPPILRLHERLGFETAKTEVWHHKWFEGA